MGRDEEGRKQKSASYSEWTPKAVGILLDSYAQKFSVGRGYLRTKDWEEVVNNVNTQGDGMKFYKSMKQCRDKVDSLKRRYKMEKRKAVNGTAVTWPFFTKLDEMMGAMLKQGRSLDPVGKQQNFLPYEYNPVDQEDEKLQSSDSPEECAVDSKHNDEPGMLFLENGKMLLLENGKTAATEVDDGLSEDGSQPRLKRQQESTDNPSEEGKVPPLPDIAGKVDDKKRKMESDNPIQALANAVMGFSEVFTRIELAKLEIFSKMKSELARIERKRRKEG